MSFLLPPRGRVPGRPRRLFALAERQDKVKRENKALFDKVDKIQLRYARGVRRGVNARPASLVRPPLFTHTLWGLLVDATTGSSSSCVSTRSIAVYI